MAIGSMMQSDGAHRRRPGTMSAGSLECICNDDNSGERCLRLVIGQSDIDRAMRAAESAWPEECCGLLLGRRDGDATVVTQIVATPNISRGDRTRSFEIDPALVLRFLQAGRIGGQLAKPANPAQRNGGNKLVGFYHSHPDGTATPSARDAAAAWPGMSYLILACRDGRSTGLSSQQWRPDAGHWTPEVIASPAG